MEKVEGALELQRSNGSLDRVTIAPLMMLTACIEVPLVMSTIVVNPTVLLLIEFIST